MVDKVPLSFVFDGAQSAAVKAQMQRLQSGFQQAEERIVRRVVEISHGHDSFYAQTGKGVCQRPQPLNGDLPAGFRDRHAAILGRMVIHQESHFPAIRRKEARQQDIPRGQDAAIRPIEVTGFGLYQVQPAFPVQQRNVDATGIR